MRSNTGGLSKAGAKLSGDALDRLIGRVKSGEVAAFEEVYFIYGKKILSYIYRMTGSRADAEDLTQETFVSAFHKIGTLKENPKFQSWLYRIAQNKVYQGFRTRPPHHESIDADEGLDVSDMRRLTSSMKNPESSIMSKELQEVVQGVINSLPEKYREVFVLSAVHQLRYQEISRIVGRSLASVKSDIHRARLRVRDKVKTYLGEDYGMSGLL